MNITTWRISRRTYLSTAFSGIGASVIAGRWNFEGDRVVYTADTMALAALELLVQFKSENRFPPLVLFPCSIPTDLITTFDPATLPHGWTRNRAVTRQIGRDFLAAAKTPVLRVPTSVVPQGWNYLLSPLHPQFKKIHIGHPVPFDFDPRLK